MVEVKRKPNNGPVTRAASQTAAARAYTEPSAPASHSVVSALNGTGAVTAPARVAAPVLVKPVPDTKQQQNRPPVITGEAQCKGMLPIDGIITGQLGASASLNVRQRSKVYSASAPEISGEISFRDMLRVNGFIAGTVYSKKGTLIVDTSSRVDANVDVAVAVICGCVNGDIVARERVEIGPNARIHGNIWTRSIQIKSGAIFEGVCRMIGEEASGF